MPNKFEIKSPTVVNLELTELCNVKCKHCYNPWRDTTMGDFSLDLIKVKKVINHLSEIGVFHVVLSGGEPMSNYNSLVNAMKLLNEKNMSFSCNTNLILANDKKMKELNSLGLDHCLTSIPSIDPEENDEIMQSKGTLNKIINGIKACIRNNVRVSANMVVTKLNKNRVYETGKMMAQLGCSKFFVTRPVPPVYSEIAKNNPNKESELVLSKEEVKKSLDDAIKVKEEFGIAIGSLVSYPLCFLGDLEKYADFVGRGCPAQRGHIVNVNSDGKVHSCVHEEESYGNILRGESLKEIYTNKMQKWTNGSLHYEGCKSCDYLNICKSGCQMTANAVNGKPASRDPLYCGKEAITKDFDLVHDNKIYNYIHDFGKFYVPSRVRFRDDGEIFVVNPRWGNNISVERKLALFLKEQQDKKNSFDLKDIGLDRLNWLANLYFKDVIESEKKLDIKKTIIGLSVDLMDIPKLNKKSSTKESEIKH